MEFVRAAEIKAEKGERAQLWITRITGRPSLDCIVLSKNPNLTLTDGKLRVFGWTGAPKDGKPNDDPDFIKESMTNHTHY